MDSEIAHWLVTLFFLAVGICGCIYGLQEKKDD